MLKKIKELFPVPTGKIKKAACAPNAKFSYIFLKNTTKIRPGATACSAVPAGKDGRYNL